MPTMSEGGAVQGVSAEKAAVGSGEGEGPTAPSLSPLQMLVTTFTTGFVVVSIETLSFRQFAPFFGTSVYVTGGVVGLVLTTLAIGYYFGGKWADGWLDSVRVNKLIVPAALWLGAFRLSSDYILEWLSSLGVIAGPLVATVVAYALPLSILSMVGPVMIKQLSAQAKVGATAGRVYAVSTGGSLLGAFGTTFVAIPSLGIRATLTLNIGLLFAVAGLGLVHRVRAYLVFVLLCSALVLVPQRRSPDVLFEKDTAYSRLRVVDQPGWVMMELDNAESQSYYMKGDATQLQWGYRGFLTVLPAAVGAKRAVLLGVGGGAVASAWRELSDGLFVDAVEIDPDVVAAARRFFGLHTDERLNVVIGDARAFIRRAPPGTYDVVAVDLFRGFTAQVHAMTAEAFAEMRRALRPGGFIEINYASGLPKAELLCKLSSTLRRSFGSLAMIPVSLDQFVLVAHTEADGVAKLRARLDSYAESRGTSVVDRRAAMIASSAARSLSERGLAGGCAAITDDDYRHADEEMFWDTELAETTTHDPRALETLAARALETFGPVEAVSDGLIRGWSALGQVEKAVEEARRALSAGFETRASASFVVEDDLWTGTKLEEADRLLASGVRRWGDDFLVGQRGRLALLRGDPSSAIALLRRARSTNPGSSLILERLGDACALLGDSDEAREAYQQARAAYPREAPPAHRGDLAAIEKKLASLAGR